MATWGELNIARAQGTRESMRNAAENRRAGRQSLSQALDKVRETLMWAKGKKQEREESKLEREGRFDIQTLAGEQGMERTQAEILGRKEAVTDKLSADWLLTEKGHAFIRDIEIPADKRAAELAQEGARDLARLMAELRRGDPNAQIDFAKWMSSPEGEAYVKLQERLQVAGRTTNVSGDLPDFSTTYGNVFIEAMAKSPLDENNQPIFMNTPEGKEELRKYFARLAAGYPQIQQLLVEAFEEFLTTGKQPQGIGDVLDSGHIPPGAYPPSPEEIPEPGSPLLGIPTGVLLPGQIPTDRGPDQPLTAGPSSIAGEVMSNYGDIGRGYSQFAGQAERAFLEGTKNLFAGPQGAPAGSSPALLTITENLKEIRRILQETPGPNWGAQSTAKALLRDLEDGKIDKKDFTKKYEELKNKWLVGR